MIALDRRLPGALRQDESSRLYLSFPNARADGCVKITCNTSIASRKVDDWSFSSFNGFELVEEGACRVTSADLGWRTGMFTWTEAGSEAAS